MKRVLVLCTGNSCRSQMAESLFRKLGGGAWEAFSAGSKPAGYVHPLAIRAMSEVGVDLEAAASKSLDAFVREDFDLVVTVCDNAAEACPAFPGAARLVHWPFEDPADAEGDEDAQLVVFRAVREQIAARIGKFLETDE